MGFVLKMETLTIIMSLNFAVALSYNCCRVQNSPAPFFIRAYALFALCALCLEDISDIFSWLLAMITLLSIELKTTLLAAILLKLGKFYKESKLDIFSYFSGDIHQFFDIVIILLIEKGNYLHVTCIQKVQRHITCIQKVRSLLIKKTIGRVSCTKTWFYLKSSRFSKNGENNVINCLS